MLLPFLLPITKKRDDVKTTKKDFKLFKEEVRKWLIPFVLRDWEIYFLHKTVEGAVAGMGHVEDAKTATFFLSEDWECHEITPYEIKKAAFHEVMELFLVPLKDLVEKRYIIESEIPPATHGIIHVLENLLFEGSVNIKPRKKKGARNEKRIRDSSSGVQGISETGQGR